MLSIVRKIISIVILIVFLVTSIKSPAYAQLAQQGMLLRMPAPGVMVHLSPEFAPALLKGLVIHPENALKFDFIVQKGDVVLADSQKTQEYTKLIKYFLASLAVPDEDQWVNLSPYEKDRIIKDDFGKTEMGRDLLAQDYMLKQITASLIYPEDNLGRKFWDKIYSQAYKQFGTSNIPVNTFNKVWIVPDSAEIYEKGNAVFLIKSHLKVMMEEDYLSLQKHTAIQNVPQTSQASKAHTIASKIVKEILIPQLETEVNEGKNFAGLRQAYSGMILAAWYKRALKESLLGKIYANKSRLKGVDQDPKNNEVIYQRYLKAYKKGVFNFIKEDIDKYTNESIPRKYFSGGLAPMKYDQIAHEDSAQVGIPAAKEILSNPDTDVVDWKANEIGERSVPDAAMTLAHTSDAVREVLKGTKNIISDLSGGEFRKTFVQKLREFIRRTSENTNGFDGLKFSIEINNFLFEKYGIIIFPSIEGMLVESEPKQFSGSVKDFSWEGVPIVEKTRENKYVLVESHAKYYIDALVAYIRGELVGNEEEIPKGIVSVVTESRQAINDLAQDYTQSRKGKKDFVVFGIDAFIRKASETAEGDDQRFVEIFRNEMINFYRDNYKIKIFGALDGYLENDGNGNYSWKGVVLVRKNDGKYTMIEENAQKYVGRLVEHIKQRFGLDAAMTFEEAKDKVGEILTRLEFRASTIEIIREIPDIETFVVELKKFVDIYPKRGANFNEIDAIRLGDYLRDRKEFNALNDVTTDGRALASMGYDTVSHVAWEMGFREGSNGHGVYKLDSRLAKISGALRDLDELLIQVKPAVNPRPELIGKGDLDMIRAVGQLEREGQEELSQNNKLPIVGTQGNESAWSALGVILGEPVHGDPIFRPATFPAGWEILPTDDDRRSNLVDSDGKIRAEIFYENGIFDRHAYVSLVDINADQRIEARQFLSDNPLIDPVNDKLSIDYVGMQKDFKRVYPQLKRIIRDIREILVNRPYVDAQVLLNEAVRDRTVLNNLSTVSVEFDIKGMSQHLLEGIIRDCKEVLEGIKTNDYWPLRYDSMLLSIPYPVGMLGLLLLSPDSTKREAAVRMINEIGYNNFYENHLSFLRKVAAYWLVGKGEDKTAYIPQEERVNILNSLGLKADNAMTILEEKNDFYLESDKVLPSYRGENASSRGLELGQQIKPFGSSVDSHTPISANPTRDLKGGIDFNAANLHIKRDGNGVPLPMVQQDMAQLSTIEGLEPVILSIQPALASPLLSELQLSGSQ